MAIRVVLGDECVALPEKLRSDALNVLLMRRPNGS